MKQVMDKASNDRDESLRQSVTFVPEETSRSNKVNNIFGKGNEDVKYRHRLFHTACIWISVFIVGWRNGMIGPTFPDLRIIIDKDLSTASWLFTAKSLGGLIGSIFGGYAYDRFNKISMFVLFVWGMGVAAGITPWCYNFVAMLSAHALQGIFSAAIDTAATADVTFVWKHKSAPYMQAINAAFSVAGIVSPLVAEPFLAEKATLNYQVNKTNILDSDVLTIDNVSDIQDVSYNTTMLQSYSMLNTTSVKYGETYVYIPYTITALICVLSGFLYLGVSCIYGNVYSHSVHIDLGSNRGLQNQYFLTKRMKIIFTIFLGLTMVFYILSENCFMNFFMTFVITEMNWSKADGSAASSLFWITLSVGRLCGIVIVKLLSLSKVIAIFFSIMATSSVLFLLAVLYGIDILIWVSVGVSGFGMSVVFASIFSWLSQYVRRLTGKITSIIFIFITSSNMVVPILVGYLMDKVSIMWFVYSQLVLVACMCLCFAFVFTFFNILKTFYKRSVTEGERITNSEIM